ncbi:unnamed protein product [Prunus armeniaca]
MADSSTSECQSASISYVPLFLWFRRPRLFRGRREVKRSCLFNNEIPLLILVRSLAGNNVIAPAYYDSCWGQC